MKSLQFFLPLIASVAAEFPDCSKSPLKDNGVCNASLDPGERARALIKLFTLDEKINNTQNTAPGVPRLGLPSYQWWNEGLHGVAQSPGVHFADSGDFSYATSFPQPILLGASFHDQLIQSVAEVTSTEARAFSNANRAGLDYWTPNINPFKDPRWGRGQETPGEDPLHIQRYVYNLITGLQGGVGPEKPKIVATCKHFAAYDLEDWQGNERYGFDAQVNSQDLSEYYLPPFKSCARDAKVGAIMCSYNALNGVPTCTDPYLLQKILREHWGWQGDSHWVTSDCDAIDNIYNDHKFTKTPEEAAAIALNNGTDLDCGSFYPQNLGAAFKEGLIKESALDLALSRLYGSLVTLGYFDSAENQPYRALSWSDVSTEEAQKLAYQAAVEGIVLLKNDAKSGLPIKPSQQKVAVVGPLANATTQMQGNYAGVARYLHSPLWAAQQHDWTVTYAPGTTVDSTNSTGFDEALTAAKAADVIFYIGGIDNTIEAEAHDRNTITWPGQQLELIQQLSQLNKTLVVVQMGGGQLDDSSLLSNANIKALLWAGYPGQDGGNAIFDIVTGTVAPAGRLPITQYPGDYVNQVPMTDMSLRPSTSNPGRTYRWYDEAVLEFGFGLHYTNFSVSFAGQEKDGAYTISELQAGDHGTGPADTALFESFKIDVKNNGKVASDYVALLFLKTTDAGPSPYPRKTLVSYARAAAVAPGAVQSLSLDVTLGSLARTDEKGNLVVYPGKYTLQVDLEDAAYPTLDFELKGDSFVLDQFPQPPSE